MLKSSQLNTVTTYAVAKRKPENFQVSWDSNPDLCNTGAALSSNQLSLKANWVLDIK